MFELAKQLRGSGYFWRSVAALLLTGFLIVLGVAALAAEPSALASAQTFTDYYIPEGPSAPGLVSIAAVVLGASLIAGQVAQFIPNLLLSWVMKRWGVSAHETRCALIEAYGEESVESALDVHQPLKRSLQQREPATGGDRRRWIDTPDGDMFWYAKHWLRVVQPQLSVDYMQAEIFFLASAPAPLLLGAVVVWRLGDVNDASPASVIPVIGALCAAVVIVIIEAWRRKKAEGCEAVRSLFLATWINQQRAGAAASVAGHDQPDHLGGGPGIGLD